MKLRIIGDGTSTGTRVFTERGDDLSGIVRAIHFNHEAGNRPSAELELNEIAVRLELVASNLVVATNDELVDAVTRAIAGVGFMKSPTPDKVALRALEILTHGDRL